MVPNHTKELRTACPYYKGEEQYIHEMTKRINPIIDMLAAEIENPRLNYCYDVEDLLKQGKD